MQDSQPGPLAIYNSLEDEHLADYFASPIRIRHLRRMGLITKDGRIVSEGTIQRNAARKEHKARTEDLLAETIVQNALELERKRRAVLKKKLEQLAKIQTVERVKSQKSHPAGVQEFNPHVLHHSFSRMPAPPPRLSVTLDSHSDKLGLSENQLYEMRKLVAEITKDRSIRHRAKSPYITGQWSRSLTPVPLAPRPPSAPKPHSSMPSQSRRLLLTHQNGRPRTAPVIGQRPLIPMRSTPARSDVQITLRYVGKNLHLEGSLSSGLSEVLVLQQHCGGNTVQVYKGRVRSRELFTFESKRHVMMPFGLTIFLDGMMDSRVSACCEYKHPCGRLLGSKTAHFRLIRVEGGRPCAKCNAEIERKERKEKVQKSLDEVINSSPSEEIDKDLNQLLARNGITDSGYTPIASPIQADTETHQPEGDTQLEPESSIEEVKDTEVQDTDDVYEDDFAKSNSEVSLDSQHSTDSERAESQTREEQSRASGVSPARSSSTVTISSLSSEESSPDLERSNQHPSEPSISPAADVISDDHTGRLSAAPEEPDTKEELVDQIDSTSPEPQDEEKLPKVKDTPDSESDQIADQEAKQLTDATQNEAQSEPESSKPLAEQEDISESVNEGTEPVDTVKYDDNSPTEEATDIGENSVDESGEAKQIASPEHPVVSDSVSNIEASTDVSEEAVSKTNDNAIGDDTVTETSNEAVTEANDGTTAEANASTTDMTNDNSVTETKDEAGTKTSDEITTPPNTVVSSPQPNLSPSLTLKEATKALEKTLSTTTSLSSLLEDGGSRVASSVDLSEQDEDIPQLEKRIRALSITSVAPMRKHSTQSSDITTIDEVATPEHTSNPQVESGSTNGIETEAEESADITQTPTKPETETVEPLSEQQLKSASKLRTEDEQTVYSSEQENNVESPPVRDERKASENSNEPNHTSEVNLTTDTTIAAAAEEFEGTHANKTVSSASINNGQDPPESKASSQLSLSSSLTSVSSQHTQSSS